MGNWCHNKLLVKGAPEEVSRFKAEVAGVEGQLIDFERLEPPPKHLDDGDVDDWYDWRQEHWGSLGNARFDNPPMVAAVDPGVEPPQGLTSVFSPGEAFYRFLTLWYPPIKLLNKLASRFPSLELTLHWAEVGFENAARVSWKEGKKIEDVELEVSDVLEKSERWF
jgi:hypothetical protein